METLNQEVFALAALYDTFSKNSSASYSEDIEISVAVDMLSLKHLINENRSATGAFDSTTAIGASSKNSSIQHIEELETLEKNSIYIYELSAFSAFDLSIDIDFEIYTINSVTYSSTHSSASSSSLSSSTSPVTMQVVEATSGYGREQFSTCSADYATTSYGTEQSSTCSADYAITSYEREQSSTCFADCMTSDYEGEQIICSANTITTSDITAKFTVTKPVVHHALLIYCLVWIQHTTLSFCMIMWMTIYVYVVLLDLTTEYKARPKVKIKRLLESEHIVPRSNIVAGILAESTYKLALFSDISTRINTSGISAVFAYKMALFSDNVQGLGTFNFEVFESTYDFGISGLQNSHLVSCNCDKGKALLLRYFGNLRYLFYEFRCFKHTTWSVWSNIRCQDCYVYGDLCCMLRDDLTRCCRRRQLVMKGSCWREGVRKWSSNETLGPKGLGSIDMT